MDSVLAFGHCGWSTASTDLSGWPVAIMAPPVGEPMMKQDGHHDRQWQGENNSPCSLACMGHKNQIKRCKV